MSILQVRAEPKSVDEDSRSVEVIIATETPVEVFDLTVELGDIPPEGIHPAFQAPDGLDNLQLHRPLIVLVARQHQLFRCSCC